MIVRNLTFRATKADLCLLKADLLKSHQSSVSVLIFSDGRCEGLFTL